MLLASRRRAPPAMTLEGALGPNDRLELAAGIRVVAPDALCVTADGRLLASSGNRVLALGTWGEAPVLWGEFERRVTALAAGRGGLVAIGLTGGGLVVRDQNGGPYDDWPATPDLIPVNDCVFLSEDEILAVDSGYRDDENFLSLATWNEGARGSVVAIERGGSANRVAAGLHCPVGICLDAAGKPLVSLIEKASLVDLSGKVLQSGYPAYLGRVRRTSTGYALACLSRRDPLIEFLKQEPEFIAEMKNTLEPRHWISPRSSPEFSHEFPIEVGATRLFGEVKPWAPSFSYGLVIETDEQFMPVASAHSRANGARHAISDVVEWNGSLIVASRASGEIINLGGEGAGA
jgi:hypothetical protein